MMIYISTLMVIYFIEAKAKISVFDSGFLLGDGVWEGIRLHNSKLVFINEHLERLFNSAHGISIDIPLSKEAIIFEIEKVLHKNSMEDDVHIRLIISRGNKDYSISKSQCKYRSNQFCYHT